MFYFFIKSHVMLNCLNSSLTLHTYMWKHDWYVNNKRSRKQDVTRRYYTYMYGIMSHSVSYSNNEVFPRTCRYALVASWRYRGGNNTLIFRVKSESVNNTPAIIVVSALMGSYGLREWIHWYLVLSWLRGLSVGIGLDVQEIPTKDSLVAGIFL